MSALKTPAASRIVIAVAFAAVYGPAAAQQTTQASAQQTVLGSYDGPYSDVMVEIRTSDKGALPHTCTTDGTGTGCTVADPQTSIPKNIGNMLCIPNGIDFKLDEACASLLSSGKGACQTNSTYSSAACTQPSKNYQIVMPACNWATSSNAATPAQWSWKLSNTSSGAVVTCSYSGYQNYSTNNSSQ
jgi:hypothetical protein